MATQWQVYPVSQRPTQLVHDIAGVFSAQEAVIGTPPNKPQSNDVLGAVAQGLKALGFEVETKSATKTNKIEVPILYGLNGQPLKSFNVDAWHPEHGAVLEVEAGIAIDARKIYQDLFEAIARARSGAGRLAGRSGVASASPCGSIGSSRPAHGRPASRRGTGSASCTAGRRRSWRFCSGRC